MTDDADSGSDEKSGTSNRVFYGVLGALAAAGLALGAAAVFGLPGGADGGGTSAARQTASAASGGQRSASSSGSGQQTFPARFDRLGVVRGSEDAPLTVREFADYQCPHCRRFSGPVGKMIDEYVDSGQVRYVFFDFPITGSHPNAMAAAQAARCAGRQGAYWAMHDALFEHQQEWASAPDPVTPFREYAGEIDGVDAERLARCVESGETREAVRASQKLARKIGVQSTPTILVGTRPVTGAIPYSRLQSMIERQLPADSAS